MPQHKKNYTLLNCKLEKTIADKLQCFVEETGLSKTAAVEKALKQYIEKYETSGQI